MMSTKHIFGESNCSFVTCIPIIDWAVVGVSLILSAVLVLSKGLPITQ